MNSIVIVSLFALTTTSLALIHETRLRRASHKVARRLILALRQKSKAQDRARDGR